MEISTQVSPVVQVGMEDNHLVNIQNNIDTWEKYHSHPQIIQKKLIQVTSVLQKENINHFSFDIKVPSTYFAGLEEKYSFSFTINDHMNKEHALSSVKEPIDNISLKVNYHRIKSIYDMHIEEVIFQSLQKKFTNTDNESIEILTSLIIFEMENLSKIRADNMEISQEMFSIENPHIKWISQINIKSQFNDYSINFENKYYH